MKPHQRLRRFVLRILVVVIMATIVQGAVSQGNPEEALERVNAFLETYRAPLLSAQVDLVVTETARRGNTFMPGESNTSHHSLITDFQSRHRLESTVTNIDLANPSDRHPLTNLDIFTPDGHWDVSISRHRAMLFRKARPSVIGSVLRQIESGIWETHDLFLTGSEFCETLGEAVSAEIVAETPGLIWAGLQPEGAWGEMVFVGYDPAATEPPLSHFVSQRADAPSLHLMFEHWSSTDPTRPGTVQRRWFFTGLARESAASPETLMALEADVDVQYTTTRLVLNAELPDSLFDYTPPEDYVFSVEQADGSLEYVQRPNLPPASP